MAVIDASNRPRTRCVEAQGQLKPSIGGMPAHDRSAGVLPDDDALFWREPHRIARRNAKGGEERIGVAERLGPAHHVWRVSVVTDEELQRHMADLDPLCGGGDEEALLRRERRRDGDRGRGCPRR